MHNEAFKELKLKFHYELLEVPPGNLEKVICKRIKDPNVKGANVTIPYKIEVMDYLDEIDIEASRIGSVNTIVNHDGMLKGYNTDGYGFLRALEEAFSSVEESRIIVLGAGGAARAICYKLSTLASELVILNRTLERCKQLSKYLLSLPECKAKITAAKLTKKQLTTALENSDILINTTPVGMTPKEENSPVDADLLRPDLLVFDAVYNPPITKLLRDAKAAGASIITGVKMLVYQGSAAFELWTGKKAPETLMTKSVLRTLNGEK
jgi:shikimate dehydrogenase